ncbi:MULTISPECIES: SAM-dependent methyltransferase [Actinosynnema]|uniref:S-adenosyl methyltransferase n=1 Tax=Actinosynnema pretiosum TaxID=42197 RepID=A0A290Z1W9_9PSEU|nr:SAM-dependent methyltransferase [Actinosynnema pretiosum]ATE52965.1 hypothetical protein CNX65_06465 [Actinosynnema pretiosum]
MTERAGWVPAGVDVGLPSAARLHDFLLGGSRNFAADRELGAQLLAADPDSAVAAAQSRAFLRRAVLLMAASGIRQFLDLGSGAPSAGWAPEVALAADPGARVVCVDFEDVAVAHGHLRLDADPRAAVVQEDLTEPGAVLVSARATGLVDTSEPLGLLAVGVLHHVPPSGDPGRVLAAYRDELAPGSLLALSHATGELAPERVEAAVAVLGRSANPVFPRGLAEVEALFDGFELLEPGVVVPPAWRPEPGAGFEDGAEAEDPARAGAYAGVGRKR